MVAGQQDEKLRGVYQQLAADSRADRKGKIYAFTSPKTGSGTSYIARQMALIAAEEIEADQHVLILDMDIQNNAQSGHFFAQETQTYYGAPTGPYDATFGTVPFWSVTPSSVNEHGQNITDTHFMSLHIVERAGVSFSHFHWERFKDGQNVHIQNARPYWHALRNHFSAIFVDTPALDRANVLGTVCPEVDTNILVSATTDAQDQSLSDLMKNITEKGGTCAGVILNDGAPEDNSALTQVGVHNE